MNYTFVVYMEAYTEPAEQEIEEALRIAGYDVSGVYNRTGDQSL